MSKSIVITFNRLPEIIAKFPTETSATVRKAAYDVEGEAKTRVPVDTGNLKNSIQTVVAADGFSAEVSVGAEYGAAVEFGSREHVIKPATKKALFWEGAEHPVKSVTIPAQPARPYMTPAAEVVRPRFEQAMGQLVERL